MLGTADCVGSVLHAEYLKGETQKCIKRSNLHFPSIFKTCKVVWVQQGTKEHLPSDFSSRGKNPKQLGGKRRSKLGIYLEANKIS